MKNEMNGRNRTKVGSKVISVVSSIALLVVLTLAPSVAQASEGCVDKCLADYNLCIGGSNPGVCADEYDECLLGCALSAVNILG